MNSLTRIFIGARHPATYPAQNPSGEIFWEFTQSPTGQIDYAGKVEARPEVDGCQMLEASQFFSPADYLCLPELLCSRTTVYLPQDFVFGGSELFSYLTHIGALLLAVEAKDSLLVCELLGRRRTTFLLFPQLTLFILKDFAAECLFSALYGGFKNNDRFLEAYQSGAMFSAENADVAAILYEAARETLKPNPQKESPQQMFVRFFQERPSVTLTLGLVGTGYHGWTQEIGFFERNLRREAARDFVAGTTTVAERKKQFFATLATIVQAEPYNPVDRNAIQVSFEGIEAKIAGLGGMKKAGYLRATAAAVIRSALPNKMSYKGSLFRINRDEEIVVQITL